MYIYNTILCITLSLHHHQIAKKLRCCVSSGSDGNKVHQSNPFLLTAVIKFSISPSFLKVVNSIVMFSFAI